MLRFYYSSVCIWTKYSDFCVTSTFLVCKKKTVGIGTFWKAECQSQKVSQGPFEKRKTFGFLRFDSDVSGYLSSSFECSNEFCIALNLLWKFTAEFHVRKSSKKFRFIDFLCFCTNETRERRSITKSIFLKLYLISRVQAHTRSNFNWLR